MAPSYSRREKKKNKPTYNKYLHALTVSGDDYDNFTYQQNKKEKHDNYVYTETDTEQLNYSFTLKSNRLLGLLERRQILILDNIRILRNLNTLICIATLTYSSANPNPHL